MQRAGDFVVVALAIATAWAQAAAMSLLTSRPRPAVISTLSDPNRMSAAESSRKPSREENSPSVVQPISAIPGQASSIPWTRASCSRSMVQNRMPACGTRSPRSSRHCSSSSSRTPCASISSLCAATAKNIGPPKAFPRSQDRRNVSRQGTNRPDMRVRLRARLAWARNYVGGMVRIGQKQSLAARRRLVRSSSHLAFDRGCFRRAPDQVAAHRTSGTAGWPRVNEM